MTALIGLQPSATTAQPDSVEAIVAANRALDQIAWMAGSWEVVHDPVPGAPPAWTEEFWTAPRGAIMLGLGRRGQGARLGTWEVMRIAADDHGRLSLHAQSEGEAGVAFALVRSSASEAVFENPQHDYPQRISYRREGDRMTATISAIDGANAHSWEFTRRGAIP